MIILSLFKSTRAAIALLVGLSLFLLIAILALSVAEYLQKGKINRIGKDENWSKWSPPQVELDEMAVRFLSNNLGRDQTDLVFEDLKVKVDEVASGNFKVSVSACGLVKPTELAEAIYQREAQKVCSNSSASFALGDVTNTETAFIIDLSAAYSPYYLRQSGGPAVDVTRFPFVQAAINGVLDKYYRDPEDNNFAAFTGFMYPYYETISRKNNIGGFNDTKLHIRGYDSYSLGIYNGFYYGYPSSRKNVTKQDLNDKLRMQFPVFKDADDLANFDDRPPDDWSGDGLPNYWDRYEEVRDGYYNNDTILKNYYTYRNPYGLVQVGSALGDIPYKKLAGLTLNSSGPCTYRLYLPIPGTPTGNYLQRQDAWYTVPCENITEPDGTPYPAGLGGNIQYVQEAWCNTWAYTDYVNFNDTTNPLNYLNVQPLTNQYGLLKDIVTNWTNINDRISTNITYNPKIVNPTGKRRVGDFARLGGMGGSNWLNNFIHAWLLLSDKWQGEWSAQSVHEKRLGVNANRDELPKKRNESSKHIIYIGSGIDSESMKSSCYQGTMQNLQGGPVILNGCFCDSYMPTENMTDDQFIEVCNKIKDSGIKIHIVLQGFTPAGDTYPVNGVDTIGQLARKYSSASLVNANGTPNYRRYQECASYKSGSDTERSFYLNPASDQVPNILEEIYKDEIAKTSPVRMSE